MLLRFHPMTPSRFRAVERSAERLELGELGFDLGESIRDHLTLVHAIETGHPLVARRFRRRAVRLERPLYDRLRAVSEKGLVGAEVPRFSPRLKSRAVRLAAASALLTYFRDPTDAGIGIGPRETELAADFYAEEIRARQGRRGSAAA